MDGRCWRCGAPLDPSAGGRCGYCGAVTGGRPVTRWRWFAHRPPGAAAPAAPVRSRPYSGPPRYPSSPRWGFTPSVWVPEPVTGPPPPDPPVRDLRSVVVLARALAVMCVVAAGAEVFRYVLLVRGRTEVLPAGQVRWSDALVVAAGWGALLLGLATAASFVPALARTGAWAAHRARIRPPRSATRRLLWLLVPGWNLWGAGVVVAEVDATVRTPPPPAPVVPPPDRLRWRSGQLPAVALPGPAAAETPAPGDVPPPVHRSPQRLVGLWWTSWALGGLLALAAAIWSFLPDGSLQSRANLVELHIAVDVVAAVTAVLTAALARSWSREAAPAVASWPAGWVLPPPAAAVPDDRSDPAPATR